MALIYCPECGHEISDSAVACPNCGRPTSARPVIERKFVAADVPPRPDAFPKWILIPIVLIAAIGLFALFYALRDDDTANTRVNVNTRRPETDTVRTGSTSSADDTASGIRPADASPSEVQTMTVPGSQAGITEAPTPTRGSVIIDARIASRTGEPRAVRNERFYLLDEDLESILRDAGIEPIEGQTLMASLGLAVVYPNRYGDFQQKAMRAIREHVKYSGTTDSTGKATLGDVEPDSYYLFGITKADRGFAVWSSPVSINAGENALNLSPQRLTEIELPSGEE